MFLSIYFSFIGFSVTTAISNQHPNSIILTAFKLLLFLLQLHLLLRRFQDQHGDAALHPICVEASSNRTNLRAAQYPSKWCHDLTEETCSVSFVSNSKPANPIHEIALCSWDETTRKCAHEDWTKCDAKDGQPTGINGNPYFCHCQPGFSGADCSGTSGCGGTGHKCGVNGKCSQGSCLCHIGWAGPTCQMEVCPGK